LDVFDLRSEESSGSEAEPDDSDSESEAERQEPERQVDPLFESESESSSASTATDPVVVRQVMPDNVEVMVAEARARHLRMFGNLRLFHEGDNRRHFTIEGGVNAARSFHLSLFGSLRHFDEDFTRRVETNTYDTGVAYEMTSESGDSATDAASESVASDDETDSSEDM